MIDLSHIPKPPDKRIAIYVKPAAERAIRKGHPWLFDQGIIRQSHEGDTGDLAVIFDKRKHFLAIGLYDPDSPIRVKLLQHLQPASIDQEWFQQKLMDAVRLREPLLRTGTNGYRLVHGENDGFPGLILDRFAETLVLKLYTAAWLPHLQDILIAIRGVPIAIDRIVLRFSRALQSQSERVYGLKDGQMLVGDAPNAPVVFYENGLRFSADVLHGHKTGFFFDHRDNRVRVRGLAKGKRVLDVFAYTGAFSVYAANGGAHEIVSLDVSTPALQVAKDNFALNQDDEHVTQVKHRIMVADAFAGLVELRERGEQFDLVIVDPPSFAKSQREVAGALRSYRQLTGLAIQLLAPDGILVMASCSSRVSADVFFDTVLETARQSGRPIIELERTGHTLDHPIAFAEGAYLKCWFARVG